MTEGERWTREALEELRTARYTPRAWASFLSVSFARATERRGERRREHRQTVLLGAGGMGLWTAVAVAGQPVLGMAGSAWWLLVVVMLDWHLGLLERPDGRPIGGLGLANLLSLVRGGLAPALLFLSPTFLALALLAAAVTDALDGWLARRRDEVTRLGLWLDGAVDSFVVGTAAVALAGAVLLPIWIAGLVVARYALPWLAVAAFYFSYAEAPRTRRLRGGQVSGTVLLAGLVLAALKQPVGTALVAAGAVGGLSAFALTARTARPPGEAIRPPLRAPSPSPGRRSPSRP